MEIVYLLLILLLIAAVAFVGARAARRSGDVVASRTVERTGDQ